MGKWELRRNNKGRGFMLVRCIDEKNRIFATFRGIVFADEYTARAVADSLNSEETGYGEENDG